MSRLTPLALLSVALGAAAQEGSRNSIRGSSFEDLTICQVGAGASRARPCEPEPTTTTMRSERDITLTIDSPVLRTQCSASVATDYVQADKLANVQGRIEIEGCAAANGEYTVSVRIQDESGESRTLDFLETWQRDDDSAVTFEADYPIGENVELINLRVRGVSCTCEERADE